MVGIFKLQYLLPFSMLINGAHSSVAPEGTLNVSIISDRWAGDSGSRAAGVFCLPNGRYDKSDFSQLIPLVEDKLQQVPLDIKRSLRLKGATSVDFVILKVNFKLCAKKYGVWGAGRPNAMTGSVSFETLAQTRNVDGGLVEEMQCDFHFDTYKKKAASDSQIFIEGLNAAFVECLENM